LEAEKIQRSLLRCGGTIDGRHDPTERWFASFVTFLSKKEKLVKTLPFPKGFREIPPAHKLRCIPS
jgi:hypothetical protein